MTTQQLSHIAQSATASIALWWMLLYLLPTLRLDVFRQKMFVIRDELFDYAMEGHIAFDHPAYLLLRKSMNGFIRYGHRLSLFQLMMTFGRWRFRDEKPVSRWDEQWKLALSGIDNADTKRKLQKLHAESMQIVIGRIITGSPILLTAIIFVAFGALCKGAWKSTADLYRNAAERTIKLFSIDEDKLEDEALRSAA